MKHIHARDHKFKSDHLDGYSQYCDMGHGETSNKMYASVMFDHDVVCVCSIEDSRIIDIDV